MKKALAAAGLCAAVGLFPASDALVAPSASCAVTAKANFDKYRTALPRDLNVVSAGGWNALQKLSFDPKAELVALVIDGIRSADGSIDITSSEGKLDALVALLQARGKGFESDAIEGEWLAVLSRQGKKSPSFQRIVNKGDKARMALNTFDVQNMQFVSTNATPRGNGMLTAIAEYKPVPDSFDISAEDQRVVLRRIMVDIVSVAFKYRKLPTLPLPLRKKGGYLDVLYLDGDIRITKGNRGGLFVHFRPGFLDAMMTDDV